MRLKKFVEGDGKGYQVRMAKPEKYRKVNPKTNREKNFKRQRFMSTDIAPKDRTFDNQPKYADGKPQVKFKDWLEIETDAGKNNLGKGADGKWYGWSHRAVYGFKAGDKVTGDSGGKKVDYPKFSNGETDWDNGKYEPDFTIKTDAQAKEVAARFADSVS